MLYKRLKGKVMQLMHVDLNIVQQNTKPIVSKTFL